MVKYKKEVINVSITRTKIGEKNGNEIFLFTMDNDNGLCAEVLSYGGIIKRLVYKGTDVVLGRDTLEEYYDNNGYFGALIGRNSNRIEGAEFSLSGKKYTLCANDGRNNLHGGENGFDKRVWDVKEIDGDEPVLELYLISPDGDEGFPGKLSVKVCYTVTKDNAFVIDYEGIAMDETLFNMTNHSYFNLNGHNSGTIGGHKLILNAAFYTPNTEECIPYGEILSVSGTPFDFTTPKTIDKAVNDKSEQISMFGGIDHNFALDGTGYRKAGILEGDKSGIRMEIYTDCSGMQIYTGNSMEKDRVCKDGAVYPIHGGICLETQAFPNSLKYSHFPNGIVKKNSICHTKTAFKFL